MEKIISFFLCLAVILGLAACGADENAKQSSSEIVLETSSETSEVSSEINLSSEEDKGSSSKKTTTSNKKVTSVNKKPSSSATTSVGKKYPARAKNIVIRKSNKKYFKCLGRGDATEVTSGITLNWSCASVEFDVDCKGDLAVNFIKSSGATTLYVEIYVDGNLLEERTKIKSTGEYTIATNLEPGVHRVKIVRQTDCEASTLTLTSISLYGNLVQKAPENRPLYIEAVGDANLIAWGVRLEDSFYVDYNSGTDDEKKAKQGKARDKENQDGTLSYAYVAAEKLNADSYIFARQGAGIAATYHKSNGEAVPKAGLLPTMYEYCHTSSNNKYTATRMPDVIVLDAGAADLSKGCLDAVRDGDTLGIDVARAGEIAVEFLKTLKAKNPKAKIIWCYGFTNNSSSLEKYVLEGAQKAGGAANGIYTLKLATSTRSGYPSAKEHAAAANLLANKINQITK